jgi:hypothetical protein
MCPLFRWVIPSAKASQARESVGNIGHMDYEYAPLRLPPNVDRLTATAQLAIQAEFSGWELARVRLFRDGTRQVMLRRRVNNQPQPGLSY